MPGKRHKFSTKEDSMIKHIKSSEMKRGMSEKEAEHRAFGHAMNLKKGKGGARRARVKMKV